MTENFSSTANCELLTGVFAGPIVGLKYETPTTSGLTNERGEFHYREGEGVTFLVGRLVLGAFRGAPRVTLAELPARVVGDVSKVHDGGATNLARLVYALDEDGDPENGVTIAPATHGVVTIGALDFDQMYMFSAAPAEETFGADPQVVQLLKNLNATDGVFSARTPRTLLSPTAARNQLRRDLRGIIKMTDVKIPLRDGSHVYADVFRPADSKTHPVVMNFGLYGKAWDHGVINDEAGAQAKEDKEDRYHSGNPDGLQYENHESVNTAEWVPNGYVTIRVDGRGAGKSPGVQQPLGRQEAEDYYDAIEWAAEQPWSNGKIGLWGMSYYAMSQHNVASLNPPHLKAMVAIGTDSDSYNDYLYSGGLFSEGFWTWWWNVLTQGNASGDGRNTDWFERVKTNTFNEWANYGAHASTFMTPDLENVTTPLWIVGTQSGAAIHQIGSSETYLKMAGAPRKFDFIDAWFPRSYHPHAVAEHMRFFDYWLKGIENGVMDEPSVRVQVRTGNAAYYELFSEQWPLADTNYTKFYLDATPSPWDGDENGQKLFKLTATPPKTEQSATYEAHLERGKPIPAPTGYIGGTPRWQTGVSFISEPLEEDMTLVGYMKAGLWVSTTSTDLDVHVSFRVIDDEDREIRYEAIVMPIDPNHVHPVGFGSLKVSHRALDAARTSDHWPVQTHTEADYAPLTAGEIVQIEVGLNPSSALVRKGCRLRVDIQPTTPSGIPSRAYDASYHEGAQNSVHTGPDHLSYLQLPLLPA